MTTEFEQKIETGICDLKLGLKREEKDGWEASSVILERNDTYTVVFRRRKEMLGDKIRNKLTPIVTFIDLVKDEEELIARMGIMEYQKIRNEIIETATKSVETIKGMLY